VSNLGDVVAVQVKFLPNNVVVAAEAGEPLLNVAARAGIEIPTGCLSGACHACEVEIANEPVCACISSVPAGQPQVTIALYEDVLW
jgi:ferredoxin